MISGKNGGAKVHKGETAKNPNHSKSDGKGDGKGNGGAPKNYGAYGGYKGVSRKDAAKLVNPEIRAAVATLRKQRKLSRQSRNYYSKQYRNQWQGQRGNIKDNAKTTQNYIEGQNAAIGNLYQDAQDQSAQAQQALMSQLQSSTDATTNMANNNLGALGLGSVGDLGGADRMALAAQQGANNQANLTAMSAGAKSIGDLFLGASSAERQSALGDARSARNEALNQARKAYWDDRTAINQEIRDTKASRRGLINQMMQQMAETGWGQYMDYENLKLSKKALAASQRQAASYSSGGSGYYGGGSYNGYSTSSSSSDTGSGLGGVDDATYEYFSGNGSKGKNKGKKG